MKAFTFFKMQQPGKSILAKNKLYRMGMFALVLGLTSFSFGQTVTTTVATGEAYSGIVPIQGSSQYSYGQQIYLAADFDAAVQGQSNRITKIRFYYVTGFFTYANNWTVYMGSTAKTEFTSNTDWVPLAGMQQVFTGILPAPAGGSWMEVTLTTPFQWDGISNVVVAVDENQSGASSVRWRLNSTGPNRSMTYGDFSQNPDPASPPGATERNSYIPQAQFVHELATAVCNMPTALTVGGLTATLANLSWTAPTPAPTGGYEYVLSTTNTAPTAGGTAISTTAYNASALVPNTNYYFFVRSACGSGSFSSWASIPFKTLAAPCSAPTSPAVSAITATSANLSWTAPSPAPTGGYEYVLSTTNTAPTAGGTAISATVYNASALIPNTNYYFFVRASCGSGNFSEWISIPFKTKSTSGVEDLEAILGLSIFPNPAGEMVTVTVNESAKVKQISLRNITGALILSVKTSGNQETFSLSQLAAGAYLMEIETDRGTLTKEFHVIH